MKTGWQAQGYTIVEVMIFLVVSSALLISAFNLIAGQQRKTEFAQSIRDVDQVIQEVVNNVQTGYYPNTGGFSCSASGSGPSFTGASTSRGENKDCIFLGRVMQFGVHGSPDDVNVFSIVGLRETVIPPTRPVNSWQEAKARPLAPGLSESTPDVTEVKQLKYGLEAVKIEADGVPVGAVGFLSSPNAQQTPSGGLLSGSLEAKLTAFGSLDTDKPTMVDAIKNKFAAADTTVNTATICFKSGGTDQYGIVTIHGDRTITTQVTIKSASPVPAECS